MEEEQVAITLLSLAGGAAEELFGDKLEEVLRNITDPSTDPKAPRRIVIEVTFKTNEEREVGDVSIKASAKLAGLKPISTVVYMGRQHGKLVAVESNPKQRGLFDAKDNPAAGPIGLAAQGGARHEQ